MNIVSTIFLKIVFVTRDFVLFGDLNIRVYCAVFHFSSTLLTS
jgi:hypothetical protein